jgi:hypothetical protein
VSGGTRFAERRVTQLPVELLWKIRAEIEAAMPNRRDLAQIKLTVFIRKRQALVTGQAVASRKTHIGRVAVGVEADGATTFATDGLNHSRDAVVIVAVCDDENGHS